MQDAPEVSATVKTYEDASQTVGECLHNVCEKRVGEGGESEEGH